NAATAPRAAAAEPAPSTPFAHEMPVPRVLSPAFSASGHDYYDLTIREARHELIRGLPTTVRSYGGQYPGPTIRARRGRPIFVRQRNSLDVNSNVHLHGGHVAAEHDGHPMDVIEPGSSRLYCYPNDQRAAPLWYHDHAHHLEAENVYRGLHASYLLSDDAERALGLPSGPYDVPLQVRDARIEEDGSLVYTRAADRPHILVNGRERPYFRVAARKYRFRLYNMSVDRYMTFRFADGTEYQQIGTDGGLLPAPVTTTSTFLSAGERADIVVDFSRHGVGSSVVLENTDALASENSDVLRFDVVRGAGDPSVVPATLAELPAMPTPTVERDFVLSTDHEAGTYLINGKTYDPERVDVTAQRGATEVWTVTNGDQSVPPPDFHVHHNFHTHLAQFRVIERNGGPPAASDAGVKDVVFVPPGDTVRIAMTWATYTGRYVYHCHHLPHSSWGQMATLEIV
ncbi:multicopper oxidase family protein, partial [Saccharomonospora saliphila]|uniref:multicopper oxidase family protein n=1 Tax=Saccharomonospora saliphila TaxID=369829 RepID=UPI00036A7081